MKLTANDALAILRKFSIADESHSPRAIERIVSSHPSATNQVVSFLFERRPYFVLIDDTAEDDSGYILEQIATQIHDNEVQIVPNLTSDITTYGMPYKGKDIYLIQSFTSRQRLDSYLAKKYPETSRSTWQKHIKAGHITLNNQVVTAPKTDIHPTDTVDANIPEPTDTSEQELPIIYLDDDVIVIDKPAGVLTHSKGALNDEFTVADFFRRYTTVGLDTNRPGIVHRLDRDTSGVMIGARTPAAADLLKRQFADRKTHKTYIAIVEGTLDPPEATIDVPIGRNPSAPSTFRADTNGKSAQTDYKQLQTDNRRSLVELSPRTGRTHQLRVHMAYVKHPIVGDRVYGKPDTRLFLHASSLEITIPGSQRVTFTSQLPDDFALKDL